MRENKLKIYTKASATMWERERENSNVIFFFAIYCFFNIYPFFILYWKKKRKYFFIFYYTTADADMLLLLISRLVFAASRQSFMYFITCFWNGSCFFSSCFRRFCCSISNASHAFVAVCSFPFTNRRFVKEKTLWHPFVSHEFTIFAIYPLYPMTLVSCSMMRRRGRAIHFNYISCLCMNSITFNSFYFHLIFIIVYSMLNINFKVVFPIWTNQSKWICCLFVFFYQKLLKWNGEDSIAFFLS